MPGKHGGRRAGAGKKPGTKWRSTLAKEAARELVRREITANLGGLISAQIANASGIKYLVGRERTSGKFVRLTQEQVEKVLSGDDKDYMLLEVWEKDPSVQAFTDLLNRALDKPKEQPHDLAVKHDGKLEIVITKPW